MSRVGKNPVTCPASVKLEQNGQMLAFTAGAKRAEYAVYDNIAIAVEGDKVTLTPKGKDKTTRMRWGTDQRNIANIVKGLTTGYTKTIEMVGVGYRASVSGANLVMQLGYSHEISYPIPRTLTVVCEAPTSIKITGANKQEVGQFAAKLREYRPPEPYKGKGLIVNNEYILRKEGKKK